MKDDLTQNLQRNKPMLRQCIIEDTIIGSVTIIYESKVEEILLSNPKTSSVEMAWEKYGELEEKHHRIADEISNYFRKDSFNFRLEDLNLSKCREFQRSVLVKAFETPFGQTNHYKDLAIKIDNPNSSRAVGNALRNNPFPIIIPCHRTIRANNEIGGFAGDLNNHYKRILLEHEGHVIRNNRVIA